MSRRWCTVLFVSSYSHSVPDIGTLAHLASVSRRGLAAPNRRKQNVHCTFTEESLLDSATHVQEYTYILENCKWFLKNRLKSYKGRITIWLFIILHLRWHAFYSYLMCFHISNSVVQNISQFHYEKKKLKKEGEKEKVFFLVISYTFFLSTYNQVLLFLWIQFSVVLNHIR